MIIRGINPVPHANTTDITAGIAKELCAFRCIKYLDDTQLSDALSSGSVKSAAVIACSDMGSSVPYVCSSPDVPLFLFQNFGHEFATGGLLETVIAHRVETLVVYGHSGCEYTKFLAKSAGDKQKNDFQSDERESQLGLYSAAFDSNSEALWEEVGRYKVLLELKRMLADSVIGELAAQERISLHGWFYKSARKQLEVFDPRQEAFHAVSISEPLKIETECTF